MCVLGLFALSTTEIPSFWHYPSAQRIAHFPSLRETLSLDYLVNCFFFSDDSGGNGGGQEGSLYMVAGRYGADEGNGTVKQYIQTHTYLYLYV